VSIEVTHLDPKSNPAGQHAVLIAVTGAEDIARVKRVFDRSLNCDPEAGSDLFDACDTLERIALEAQGA